MNRIYIILYMLVTSLVAACGKDSAKPSIPSGSIFIQGLAAKDTLVKEVGIARDTFFIIGLHAVTNGQAATSGHIVTFRVDSARLPAFRAKYGNATLLPREAYFFYRPQCRIPAGATVSDSVQLNMVAQTKLKPETVYVLPLTIEDVDGVAEAVAPGQVFYVIVKTGKKPGLDRSKWQIISVSSVNNAASGAELVLDDKLSTIWASAYGPMPQNLVIDFGASLTFKGVTYAVDASSIGYGVPTKVKIEVSTNGTAWTDKGTYTGSVSVGSWTHNIGVTTARYMRFTVLEAAPYFFGLELVFIGDISIIL